MKERREGRRERPAELLGDGLSGREEGRHSLCRRTRTRVRRRK